MTFKARVFVLVFVKRAREKLERRTIRNALSFQIVHTPNEFRTRGARALSGIALTEKETRIFFLEFALLGIGVTSSRAGVWRKAGGLQPEHVVEEEEEKPQEEEKANNNNHAGKQRT